MSFQSEAEDIVLRVHNCEGLSTYDCHIQLRVAEKELAQLHLKEQKKLLEKLKKNIWIEPVSKSENISVENIDSHIHSINKQLGEIE